RVNGEDRIPVRVWDLLGRAAALDSGDVYEHVESAELFHDVVKNLRYRFTVRHIKFALHHTLVAGSVFELQVDGGDAGSFREIAVDDGRADAGSAAGDDDALSFKLLRHVQYLQVAGSHRGPAFGATS